jgi:hypothetical protein
MVRSPLEDIPPFDKAVPLPDSLFIPDIWGFGAVAMVWRDWKEQRRKRRALRRERRAARRSAARR